MPIPFQSPYCGVAGVTPQGFGAEIALPLMPCPPPPSGRQTHPASPLHRRQSPAQASTAPSVSKPARAHNTERRRHPHHSGAWQGGRLPEWRCDADQTSARLRQSAVQGGAPDADHRHAASTHGRPSVPTDVPADTADGAYRDAHDGQGHGQAPPEPARRARRCRCRPFRPEQRPP